MGAGLRARLWSGLSSCGSVGRAVARPEQLRGWLWVGLRAGLWSSPSPVTSEGQSAPAVMAHCRGAGRGEGFVACSSDSISGVVVRIKDHEGSVIDLTIHDTFDSDCISGLQIPEVD